MKIAINFVVSLAALGALLGATVSQATNVAELPLKASVLAKPNVIFGMDESGSMDAEVMIDGNVQGWFYGNTSSTTLYPAAPAAPAALRATGTCSPVPQWHRIRQPGLRRSGGNQATRSRPRLRWPGHVRPTTPDLLRQQQDLCAVVAGLAVGRIGHQLSDANPAAARSHPVNGSTTVTLNANLTNSSANWKFAHHRMTIRSGRPALRATLARLAPCPTW
jgi:hypothetical protein